MADNFDHMVSQETRDSVAELAQRFSTASPFRYVAIDNFFSEETAHRLAENFPAFDEKLAMNENGVVGGKAVNEKVRGLGKPWAELDDLVQGSSFRSLITDITGVPRLKYDPHYFGGGTHENLQGQGLDAHVDFNFHPITRQHRRLNLIIYLTEEAWQDDWGGSIQLHKDPYLPPSLDEIKVVTPLFNRCVIFETNEYSWHGFPRIDLPEDKRDLSRRSFALYYYTDTRPAQELGPEHSTIYVEQHLPESLQAGEPLDPETVQHIRNLVGSRDQHLRRLYENIKQIYTELNHLREQTGLQDPPGIADEPLTDETLTDEAELTAGQGSVSVPDETAAQAELADDAAVEVETDVDALQEHVQRLEQERELQLAQQDNQIRLLQGQVDLLKQSTSWRITRPMRQLKRLLTGAGS